MKAVFLDRDGVINENRDDHVKSWDEFRFIPGAIESIARLNRAGFLVIVVTNQAIVNGGLLSRCQVEGVNYRMVQEIAKGGGQITEVLTCPHRPDENCFCRKPNPGLINQASARYSLDLSECYVVGDAVTDIAAGMSVGCRSFLVLTGRGLKQFLSPLARRHYGYWVVRNLEQAVQIILHEEEREANRHPLPVRKPIIESVAYSHDLRERSGAQPEREW